MGHDKWLIRLNVIIDDALAKCNWSYGILAARIGVGQSTIYRWRNGKSNPIAEIVDRLCVIAYDEHIGKSL